MPPERTDDKTIKDDDELWRRIFPGWVVRDDNTGGVRISSQAFEDSKDGSPCSVFVAKIVIAQGRSAPSLLAGYASRYSLASIAAGVAREQKQSVCREPTPDEPAHGVLFGKKSGAVRNALARHATAHWFLRPS